MIWHGGQEGLCAERGKLTESRNARDRRIPFKRVRFPLVMRQETASIICLVAILQCENSRTTFGQQSWAGVWTQGWTEVTHVNIHRIGAGTRVHKESGHDPSLQTTCRTTYGSRTPVQCIIHLCVYVYIFKYKRVFNLSQGVQ